jgi:hypothetical protein
MAQTGFTPLQLYSSTTASAVPVAGNLAGGELAINIVDGKLFYKDNAGIVQIIAYKNVPLSTVTGTLAIANGGTGLTTTPANGQLDIGNGTGFTRATLTAGSGISVTNSSGGITIASTVTPGTGTVTSVGGTGTVNGITLTGTVTTSGDLTLGGALSGVNLASQVTGTLPAANGGTGQTTLTGLPLPQPIITQNIQDISTDTTAVRSRTYVMTASLTLTLPSSPTVGDMVMFSNKSGTTTPVIARNGQNIEGLAEDMTVDNVNYFGTLVYANSTRGWIFQ